MLSDSDSSDPLVTTDIIHAKIQHLTAEELVDLQKKISNALDERQAKVTPTKQSASARSNETALSPGRTAASTDVSRAVDEVKDLLKPLIVALRAAKGKNERYMWWFPLVATAETYLKNMPGGSEKQAIATLASHVGKSDDEFIRLLKVANLYGHYRSWKSKVGFSVCHRRHGTNTNWIILDEDDALSTKFDVLPHHQLSGEVRCPRWIGVPKMGFIKGTTEAQRVIASTERQKMNEFSGAVDRIFIGGILSKLLVKANRSRKGIPNRCKVHTIADRQFNLPINYEPILCRDKVDLEQRAEALSAEAFVRDGKIRELLRWREENETNASIGSAISSIATMDGYPSTDQSRRFYALAMADAPSLSVGKLSQISPLIVGAALHDLGLSDKVDLEQLPNITPSQSTLRSILREGRELSLRRVAKALDGGRPVGIAHDKGERAGIGRLIKELSWWEDESDRVSDVRVNSDGSKGKSHEVAAAIDLSMQELDAYRTDGKRTRFCVQTTDSGGGGVGQSAVDALEDLDRIDNFVTYVLICCLHGQSKCLQNAIVGSYGDGELGAKNWMQLVHTCWSLQEALGDDFKSIWFLVNPTKPAPHADDVAEGAAVGADAPTIDIEADHWNDFSDALDGLAVQIAEENREPTYEEVAAVAEAAPAGAQAEAVGTLQKPVSSRWWHVNTAAQQVNEALVEWEKLFQHCKETSDKENSQRVLTISTNGLRLIKNKKILCDLEFFCLFSKYYWSPHTKWMHRIDEITRKYGHSAHNVPVRSMIMYNELNDMAENFETDPRFASWMASVNNLPDGTEKKPGKVITLRQAHNFFDEYKKTYISYYQRWWKELVPFAIAGTSPPCATEFARWYFGMPTTVFDNTFTDNASTYYCAIHDRSIDIYDWRAFLDEMSGDGNEVDDPILLKHENAVEKIAEGAHLYEELEEDPDVAKLLRDCKLHMLIGKHHTQSTEGGVRDISICSSTRRSEEDSSALSLIRSLHISPINEKAAEEYRHRLKRGNRHMSGGRRADREPRSPAAKRRRERGLHPGERPTIANDKARAKLTIAHLEASADSPADREKAKEGRKRKKGAESAGGLRKKQTLARVVTSRATIVKKARANRLGADVEPVDADVPPEVLGMKKFSFLQKNVHMNLVKAELDARGEGYGERDNITALVGKLKKWKTDTKTDMEFPDHIRLLTLDASTLS